MLRLLETRNGWYIKKWVIYYVRWMILSLNLQSVYYSVIYFLLYWFDSIYIERNCLVGAAKPPHIHWPAFLKLKIEIWERIWISKMGPIWVKIEREFEFQKWVQSRWNLRENLNFKNGPNMCENWERRERRGEIFCFFRFFRFSYNSFTKESLWFRKLHPVSIVFQFCYVRITFP